MRVLFEPLGQPEILAVLALKGHVDDPFDTKVLQLDGIGLLRGLRAEI